MSKTLNIDLISNKKEIFRFVEEYYGFDLYPSQIKAINHMVNGKVVELQTGEGKSVVLITAALCKYMFTQKKQLIVYHNDYIAEREYENCKLMGPKMYLIDTKNGQSIQNIYNRYLENDIIFASVDSFMYLFLKMYMMGKSDLIPLESVLIDEIDLIAIDMINTSYSVSMESTFTLPITYIEAIVDQCEEWKGYHYYGVITSKDSLAIEIDNQVEYIIVNDEYIEYTTYGLRKLEVSNVLNNTMAMHFIRSYLHAKELLKVNIDYIVKDMKIVLVNRYTGRTQEKSKVDYAVHSFLEYMNGLTVTKKSLYTFGLSYSVVFNEFEYLTGTSGTCLLLKETIKTLYNADVIRVKSFLKKEYEYKKIYHRSYEESIKSIKKIREKHIDNAILIICTNDYRSEEIYEQLVKRVKSSSIMLLNSKNINDENSVIEKLSKINALCVSTNVLSRGTDIKPLNELVLIVLGSFRDRRHRTQAFGRTSRNGQYGYVYEIQIEDEYRKYISESTKELDEKEMNRVYQIISNNKSATYIKRKKMNYIKYYAIEKLFKELATHNQLSKKNIHLIAKYDSEISEEFNIIFELMDSDRAIEKAIKISEVKGRELLDECGRAI